MSDRVVSILGRLRARLLLVRSAEAAAVGATAGGLVAAALMAGRIVAGVAPAAAAGLSAAPLAAGVVLAVSRRLRGRVSPQAMLQWYVVALAVGCGGAGTAWALSGAFAYAPKNWLVAIAPAAGVLAAAIVLIRGATLPDVAVTVDRRAELKERLATAWELHQAEEQSLFAGEVRSQVLAAIDGRRARRVRFWDRTRATAGALALALLAAALMLPWDVIESQAHRQRRRWGRLAPEAGRAVQEPLATLDADALARLGLAGEVRKLEALAEALRAARPEDAARWQGKVVELDRLAEALRRIIRTGRLDAAAARRLEELIRTVEEASAALADGMAEPGQFARLDPATLPATPPPSTPTGWTHVYNPAYADFARTRPAATGPDGPAGPPVAVPFDRQWAEARRRASQSLGRQTVPPKHRRLVRDFFAAE